MTTPKSDGWFALSLTVATDRCDEVAGVLGQDSLGVEHARASSGHRLLRVYFDRREDAERMCAWAGRQLPDVSGLAVEPVADQRWVESYRSGLRPLPLGERFVVVPGEETRVESGRTVIRLTPGRAFGTGEHPTTRLCAAELERHVVPGSRWLDVGTGTGVLALVAAHCGASEVLAVDIDPEAVAVAREIVGRSDVASRIVVCEGSAGLADGREFDGIVINIAAGYLESEAGSLARALREDGVMIASGFEGPAIPEVARALDAAGFVDRTRAQEGGWAAVVFKRGSRGERPRERR